MFICLFYVRKNWEENFWVRMKSVQMTKIWWCKGSSWAWILYFFSDDEKLFNLNLDEEKKQQDSSDRQGCIIKLCDSFMPKWQLEAEKNRRKKIDQEVERGNILTSLKAARCHTLTCRKLSTPLLSNYSAKYFSSFRGAVRGIMCDEMLARHLKTSLSLAQNYSRLVKKCKKSR